MKRSDIIPNRIIKNTSDWCTQRYIGYFILHRYSRNIANIVPKGTLFKILEVRQFDITVIHMQNQIMSKWEIEFAIINCEPSYMVKLL